MKVTSFNKCFMLFISIIHSILACESSYFILFQVKTVKSQGFFYLI